MKNYYFFLTLALGVLHFNTGHIFAQEIGLQLYSLRNEFKTDVEGTFKRINSLGITKLEDGLGGTYGLGEKAYKELLKKHNLELVSMGASFEELRDTPEKVLERVKSYSAKYVVCFSIPHKNHVFTIQEALVALDVFNNAGKILKEEGITLAYHAHGFEFRPYEGATLMDYMVKNATYFDFEMDVYWFAHAGEDSLTWLQRYPEKFKLMHLKDCKKGVKGNQNGISDSETNVVLGSGQIGIASIVKEAKKIGIEYLFIEDESSRAMQQIPESLEYLKSLRN